MASGHVNRVNRPNTWPQPTSCTVKKTLANKEPSTHGTTPTLSLCDPKSALAARADVQRQALEVSVVPQADQSTTQAFARARTACSKTLVADARSSSFDYSFSLCETPAVRAMEQRADLVSCRRHANISPAHGSRRRLPDPGPRRRYGH